MRIIITLIIYINVFTSINLFHAFLQSIYEFIRVMPFALSYRHLHDNSLRTRPSRYSKLSTYYYCGTNIHGGLNSELLEFSENGPCNHHQNVSIFLSLLNDPSSQTQD